MTQLYSLHKIHHENQFGFSPLAYSRFKFGDEAVAREFGIALAKGFIKQHLAVQPVQRQMVVISSPYAFIPTATFAMKDYFVSELNRWLANQQLPVVQEAKVHRTVTYKEDYGDLSAEERINLISNDSFHIDKAFLSGKVLVFLDDIKITGSHQRMIEKMIHAYALDNPVFMLYFAELVNHNIHPKIENYLNYYYVKSIFDLDGIIKSGMFRINTRLVKYILNYNHSCFRLFINDQDTQFVQYLYDMAIGNGYHLIDAYIHNLNFIKENFIQTTHKLVNHGN
jgi:hypothetical protein